MTSSEDYRAQVRRTMQAFSDEALAYQDARIVGGIDRQECDREIARRATARRKIALCTIGGVTYYGSPDCLYVRRDKS